MKIRRRGHYVAFRKCLKQTKTCDIFTMGTLDNETVAVCSFICHVASAWRQRK